MKATIINIKGFAVVATIAVFSIFSSFLVGVQYGQSQVGCQSLSDVNCGR